MGRAGQLPGLALGKRLGYRNSYPVVQGTPAQLGPAVGTQEVLSPLRTGGCLSFQPQQAGDQLE